MARFVLYTIARDHLPPRARAGVRHAADRLLMPVGSVTGARTRAPVVALTFDDGPDPDATMRLLDVLARDNVMATFFVLVQRAEAHPQIVRRAIGDGHEVGLHGIDHTDLTSLPLPEVRARLREGRDRLEAVTGRPVRWFRPAYGAQTLRTFLEARRAGLDVVVWSVDPKDYAARDAMEVAARTTRLVHPGAIVSLHDGDGEAEDGRCPPWRVDCAAMAGSLLDGLAGRGYRTTTLTELLAGKRTRRAWFHPGPSTGARRVRPAAGTGKAGDQMDQLPATARRAESVTLAVVTYNSASLLPQFFAALPAALDGVDTYEVVIADNASTDSTLEVIGELAPQATVAALDSNRGYAAGVNAAVAKARPDSAVYVLNPDVRLQPGSVRVLLDALSAPGAGIAVPRTLTEEGGFDPVLRREPSVLRALGTALCGRRAGFLSPFGEEVMNPKAYRGPTTADWACGAALMISRPCIEAIGPWDETFFLYSEETDFCLRARDRGFATRLEPEAIVVHIGGGVTSRLYAMLVWNKYRLYRKRHGAARSALFRSALVLGEALRAATGNPLNREGLAALLSSSRRPPEVAGRA